MSAGESQFQTGFRFPGRVTEPGIVIDVQGRIWHVQIDGSRVELGQGIPPQVAARGLVSEAMDPLLAALSNAGSPSCVNWVGTTSKVMLAVLGVPRGQEFSKMQCFPFSTPSGGTHGDWRDVTLARMALWKPDGTFVACTGDFHSVLGTGPEGAPIPIAEDLIGAPFTADVTSYLGGLLLLSPSSTFAAGVVGVELFNGSWPDTGSILGPFLDTTEDLADLTVDITPKSYEAGDVGNATGVPYLALA